MNTEDTDTRDANSVPISTALFGTPLSECDDVERLRLIAEVLWGLLEDIDTASDMFKPSTSNPDGYPVFYRYAMKKALRRRTALYSDGYNLFLPNDEDSRRRNKEG